MNPPDITPEPQLQFNGGTTEVGQKKYAIFRPTVACTENDEFYIELKDIENALEVIYQEYY